jgi:hypothetical protein
VTGWGAVSAKIAGVTYTEPDGVPFLTFAGTWAAPGVGYPSDVLTQASDRAVEVPVQAPWSFGPIPPGELTAPSYQRSIAIGLEWAVNWLLTAHPSGPFGVGGYSQGAECASMLLLELGESGRLAHRAADFIGGFAFGNPCREMGHSYPGGADPHENFSGISPTNLVGTPATFNDYAQPGDMYACTPTLQKSLLGGALEPDPAGEIMRDCYTLATEMQIGDGGQFILTLVQNCIDVANDLRILGGDATIADAIQAATIAIGFVATQPPTQAHISYQWAEAEPGCTYLEHAVRHVNALVGG